MGEEVFEFGEYEWCVLCAAHGCKLLEAAAAAGKLDLSAHSWGFSEEYTQCPERLAERFDEGRSVYWFMIHEGKVSSGASVKDEGWGICLSKPGFHIAAQWGLIAHASGMIYGPEGMPQRAKDTAILNDNLLIECRPAPTALTATLAEKAAIERPKGEAFPGPIGAALSGEGTELEGLHNAGALIMKRSPEVAYLPMSAIGIPALHKMDDAQKEAFYHLLQRPLRPVFGSDLRQTGAFGLPGSMAAENEFGDLPWCKACAEHGVKLIEMSVEAGEISLDGIEWAFSEEYTEACPRVLGGRKIAVYWFAVSGGKIHAGWEDLPDWVLALQPGFHIAASWALLAGPSGAIYGTVGSNLRNYHSGILNAQLKAVGKDKPPQASIDGTYRKKPAGAPFFHPDIGKAMRDRPGGPPGLHNFAAYTGGRVPPELEGLPMTTSYNIDLPRCTEEQKEQFYAVLGRNPGHPMHIPSQYE